MSTPLLDAFHDQRPRLLGLAYRITGSHSDAEDVLQDAWLRIERTDQASIVDPVGWLVTVVSRLALDELKRAHRRRESYVGPWLPEPVPTGGAKDDPAVAAELSESLTLAFLQLLDTLSPSERVAFLLADVFRMPYKAIGEILERSEASCRQLASRARRRLEAEPQPSPDRLRFPDAQQFVDAFLSGDLARLTTMLDLDVVLLSDGGPNLHAARRPVVGAHRVGRFIANLGPRFQTLEMESRSVNQRPGFVARIDGHVVAVGGVDAVDGRITTIRIVVNPDKLGAFEDDPHLV